MSTLLDGIPMGTRCGSIDPAVALYLQDQGMTAAAIPICCISSPVCWGLSGETDDMAVLASASAPAQQAIEQFVHHTARTIGSLAAAIGERCQWLGLHLDSATNQHGRTCISQPDIPVQAWVIATDEESMIARHSLRVLELHKQRNTS